MGIVKLLPPTNNLKLIPSSGGGLISTIGNSLTKQISSPAIGKQNYIDDFLPSEPKVASDDIGQYTFLLYGVPKIGKTTVFSSWPKAIFFCTEPGTKGLEIFEYNSTNGGIYDWNVFRKGVDLLCSNRGKFQTVVIDTVDRAYDMCRDWVCKELGIEYPGEDEGGKQDRGISWNKVKTEFLTQIHRISQSGHGLCLTSHSKENIIKSRGGEQFSKIIPSMSGQARSVIEAIVDYFFYAEYVKDARILMCGGDETIWAGARSSKDNKNFPRFIPMVQEGTYDLILAAFRGEYHGLDISTIIPGRITTETGLKYLQKLRTDSAMKLVKKPN